MAEEVKSPILVGRKAITEYLGIGVGRLDKWRARGLPVYKDSDGGLLYAHKDNLSEFFKRYTRRRSD